MALLNRLGFSRLNGAEGVLSQCRKQYVACAHPMAGLEVAHYFALHAAGEGGLPVNRAFRNQRLQSQELVRSLRDVEGRLLVDRVAWAIPGRSTGQYETQAVEAGRQGEVVPLLDQSATAQVSVEEPDVEERSWHGISFDGTGGATCPCCSAAFPAH